MNCRIVLALGFFLFAVHGLRGQVPSNAELGQKARAVFETHCHRCHGQDGSLEGGMNYVLDSGKLVARKKIIPGNASSSPLFKRVASGKMPPADVRPRPTENEIAALKEWIDAGAASFATKAIRIPQSDAWVQETIRTDLESLERRSRRFQRYFTLSHLYNLGLGEDELQTYRSALSKLLNSLSWHPRITKPTPIDAAQTLFRIDLRNYAWDAGVWNRLLADYPYAVVPESAAARAVMVSTGTRVPIIRVDWFLATASRPPLYYDLLQLPTTAGELERQLRIDANADIQQERVARAGFNGSGVSRNNRLIERHDSVHGAYWRTYDFEEVKANLVERDGVLPDRRNLFAYPLGPGFTDNTFQHAGGEVIFNLPNGLQAYMLVNANNERIAKAPTAIVSDPRRPDRAVEPGLSCMSCHLPGILPKVDQIRDHVAKNPKLFPKPLAEAINALYPVEKTTTAFMHDDAERYQTSLAKTGVKLGRIDPINALVGVYESDLDLPTAAAEFGCTPGSLTQTLAGAENLAGHLGVLRVAGTTISRAVFVQAFADAVRALRRGTPLEPGLIGASLTDNTGELDPLEGPARISNAAAFTADGRFALLASADRSLRLWDIEGGHETRRYVGHRASVWCVALSKDNTQALSGGADAVVRLWDVEKGREIRAMEGHDGLVTAVAFTPDGAKAVSAGYDNQVILWDVNLGRPLKRWTVKSPQALVISHDGRQAAIAGGKTIQILDLDSGEKIGDLTGHGQMISALAISPDCKTLATGDDEGEIRIWDWPTRKEKMKLLGHEGPVLSLAFGSDGKTAASGGADHSARIWNLENQREAKQFTKPTAAVLAVSFLANGRQFIAGCRDSAIHVWPVKVK